MENTDYTNQMDSVMSRRAESFIARQEDRARQVRADIADDLAHGKSADLASLAHADALKRELELIRFMAEERGLAFGLRKYVDTVTDQLLSGSVITHSDCPITNAANQIEHSVKVDLLRVLSKYI